MSRIVYQTSSPHSKDQRKSPPRQTPHGRPQGTPPLADTNPSRSDWNAFLLESNACQHCCTSVTHGFCCIWKFQMHLEMLHSDCFCCMWYLICLEILHSHWMSSLLQKKAALFLSLHSDWQSALQSFGGGLLFSNGLKWFCNIRNKFVTAI